MCLLVETHLMDCKTLEYFTCAFSRRSRTARVSKRDDDEVEDEDEDEEAMHATTTIARVVTFTSERGRAQRASASSGSSGSSSGRPGRMHVPSDAFQGRSPEVAARDALKRLFTMVAVRSVIEAEGDSETGRLLQKHLDETPMVSDGNDWVKGLMARDEDAARLTALKLLDVRKTYADEVFDFDACKEVVIEEIRRENDKLMADYVKRLMPTTDDNN